MNDRRERSALSRMAAKEDPVEPGGRDPLAPKQILVTGVGLLIPAAVDFCAWEQAGVKIARIAECSAWCLGDWLVYGEHRYADRYKQVIAAARLDYQTLRNYAWVTRRFDLGRRREELSFQHHAEVAALPTEEQDRWLDLSIGQGWSRNELRRNLRSGRDAGLLAARTVALPRMRILPENLARWRGAAEQMNQELEEWVVATLEHGARQVLTAGSALAAGLTAEVEA